MCVFLKHLMYTEEEKINRLSINFLVGESSGLEGKK